MIRLAFAIAFLLTGGGVLAQGNVEAVDTIDKDGAYEDAERVPSQTVIPEYPRAAWLDQIQGDAQICFFVTRSGRPYNIAVRKSDHKVFERPSREAVKLSWFEAIPRSENVPQFRTCRTFQFRLESVPPEEAVSQNQDST